MRGRDPQAKKPYCHQALIGEMRRRYGADFAKGFADNERLIEVLRKLPSLRRVIRDHEAMRFDRI